MRDDTDYYDQESAREDFLNSIAMELYPDHKEQAIDEFIMERLKSYYLEYPDSAVKISLFIKNSERVLQAEPTYSLLLSVAATESIIKTLLLKPLIYGLVHTDSLAGYVSDLLVKQSGMDNVGKLVFKLFDEFIYCADGFENYKRAGNSISLWQERKQYNDIRNLVAHRTEFCSQQDANESLAVAKEFFTLVTTVLKGLDFQMLDDGDICSIVCIRP
jgi:hypothetical protein